MTTMHMKRSVLHAYASDSDSDEEEAVVTAKPAPVSGIPSVPAHVEATVSSTCTTTPGVAETIPNEALTESLDEQEHEELLIVEEAPRILQRASSSLSVPANDGAPSTSAVFTLPPPRANDETSHPGRTEFRSLDVFASHVFPKPHRLSVSQQMSSLTGDSSTNLTHSTTCEEEDRRKRRRLEECVGGGGLAALLPAPKGRVTSETLRQREVDRITPNSVRVRTTVEGPGTRDDVLAKQHEDGANVDDHDVPQPPTSTTSFIPKAVLRKGKSAGKVLRNANTQPTPSYFAMPDKPHPLVSPVLDVSEPDTPTSSSDPHAAYARDHEVAFHATVVDECGADVYYSTNE